MRKTATPHIYAFFTVLLWSSAYVYTKVALEHFSGPVLGFLRCAVASGVLVLVMLLKRAPAPKAADLPKLALSGALGFALYLLAFNKGSESLNPTTSCIIISTAPIISAVIARFYLGEKIGPAGWCAVLVAFGGVLVLMLWDGSLAGSSNPARLDGIGWMLLAALLISLYNIMQRRLSRRYGALQITACSFLAGALLLAWLFPETLKELRAAPASQLAVALFLGVFPSALAYLLWARALACAPQTGTVTNYMYLTPFLALLLEYVVIADLPGPGTFIGGGIILGSLVLFGKAGRAEKRVFSPENGRP